MLNIRRPATVNDRSPDLCEFLRDLTVKQSDDRSRGRPIGDLP